MFFDEFKIIVELDGLHAQDADFVGENIQVKEYIWMQIRIKFDIILKDLIALVLQIFKMLLVHFLSPYDLMTETIKAISRIRKRAIA